MTSEQKHPTIDEARTAAREHFQAEVDAVSLERVVVDGHGNLCLVRFNADRGHEGWHNGELWVGVQWLRAIAAPPDRIHRGPECAPAIEATPKDIATVALHSHFERRRPKS